MDSSKELARCSHSTWSYRIWVLGSCIQPSPRDLLRWDQEVLWVHSDLVTPKNAVSAQVCTLAGLQHGKWDSLWGLGDTGKSGCHIMSDICDLLCTELGLFPCKPSCSPSKAPGSPPKPISSSSLCPDPNVSMSPL